MEEQPILEKPQSPWADKHALVTGGSAGLGLAIADACLTHGMRVTLVARDEGRLAAAKALLGDRSPSAEIGTAEIGTLVADLATPGEAERVVLEASATSPIDFLCHAAGRSTRGRIVETPRSDFEELLAINFLAAVELAAAAAPHLAARQGHFVLIGSLASRVAPALLGAYPASKHPVAALAQQLRLELGPDGLHTLLVCPGPLARDDAGQRYDEKAKNLPESARKPGGGAKVKAIDPEELAAQILRACERRQAELIVPRKARLLFILSQISPRLGDWLLRRSMKS